MQSSGGSSSLQPQGPVIGEGFVSLLESYANARLERRAFLARVIGITGSMAAAHLLLERSGIAATLLSKVESEKAGVVSSTVSYHGGGNAALSAYLSVPAGDKKQGAVIVIHENRGLNEHTRDVARRFAAQGYVALAPDLLSRKGGTGSMKTEDEARTAIAALSADQVLSDLEVGLAYLNIHPRVASGRLGAVGFCWGGARSFALAAESQLLRAAVVFYGSTPPPEQLAKVHCPVLGLYGETDTRITAHVPDTDAELKAAGKSYQYHIYPGAGHAFFNDTGPNYNAAAATDAWQRTLQFLGENLA